MRLEGCRIRPRSASPTVGDASLSHRPSSAHAKVDKDLVQASLLVDLLEEERPGDLRRAWQAVRGRGWSRRMREAASLLRKRWPDAHARLVPILK